MNPILDYQSETMNFVSRSIFAALDGQPAEQEDPEPEPGDDAAHDYMNDEGGHHGPLQ